MFLGIKLKGYTKFSKTTQILKLRMFIIEKDFFLALNLNYDLFTNFNLSMIEILLCETFD